MWMKSDVLSSPKRHYLIALIAGALLPLAFAPANLYPLAFLLPAVLFFLFYRAHLDNAPYAQLARCGFFFGLGVFGSGVSWVYVAIHDFGLSSVPVAVLLTAMFVIFLGSYFLVQAVLGHWLIKCFKINKPFVILVVIYPAIWVLMEWFRGWFLTGFPWLNLGYSQVDTPLAGFAALFGVYSVSWLVVLIAGLLVYLFTQKNKRLLIASSILLLFVSGGLLLHIEWTPKQGPSLAVALVQGNMPQRTKWDENAVAKRVERYAQLSRQHWDKQLIVWPENSMTAFYHQLKEPFLDTFNEEARAANTDLVIGIPFLNQETFEYYSSFMTLGQKQMFYHKTHLVPFGEYLPFNELLRGLINFFSMPMSNFSRGDWMQPLLQAGGQKIAPTICYEDAFGEELIRYLPEATLLVNGSNNAWYGDSLAPHQHLQIARMRTIETGRDLMRATTNGISALVDHKGNILARSRQFQSAVVTGSVQPRSGATPYVGWGNTPIISVLLLLLFVFTVPTRK
ncbi:MAG: apolipoprotein N-acyltransferase [Thioalkalispiraceae bacterium]|jgi:apolipoprotein N-acyltransferase